MILSLIHISHRLSKMPPEQPAITACSTHTPPSCTLLTRSIFAPLIWAFTRSWQSRSCLLYTARHGREGDYKPLAPAPIAYYDGCVEVDLSKVESMIALPMHPSHAMPIRVLLADPVDIPVSYTHLDVYKRQGQAADCPDLAGRSPDA